MSSFVDGRLFQFSKTDKNLVAFVSLGSDHKPCKNAVILIPGLTDGFMSMAYSSNLSKTLREKDFSLVMAQISSSFMQFGFSNIDKDCDELTLLVSHLKEEMAFEKIVFIGHSTGAQDVVYFLRQSPMKDVVDAVVLQGAVGDRDSITADPNLLKLLGEARKLREEGRENVFLSEPLYDAPVTALRFLSLAERLSKEDMFSVDLTEEELSRIFKAVRVPILLCFSAEDEYVPDHPAQKKMAEKLVNVLAKQVPQVEYKYFTGDHGLTQETMYSPFVKYAAEFIFKNVKHD